MNILVTRASLYNFEDHGQNPLNSRTEGENNPSDIFAASPPSEVDEITKNEDTNTGSDSLTTNYEQDKIRKKKHGKGRLIHFL